LISHGPEVITAETIDARHNNFIANIDIALGDYHHATQLRKTTFVTTSATSPTTDIAIAEIGEHDLTAARDVLANPVPSGGQSPGYTALMTIRAVMQLDSEAQDWSAVLADGVQADALAQKYSGLPSYLPTMTAPLTAYASAGLGNIAAAEVKIAPTPGDCYDCLITRARIAEVEGKYALADSWFGRAIKSNPSIPFAYSYWGQALLDRGDPDGAIAKFTIANQKGPHFADPLEYWGEALMKKNRSDLALAKFTEAEKYAPNWGRLHLKWGEALDYARRKDDAQKQFAVAAGLALSNDDKAELAKVSHG
jgi:tetratricopeptide (TPR) repeat protein